MSRSSCSSRNGSHTGVLPFSGIGGPPSATVLRKSQVTPPSTLAYNWILVLEKFPSQLPAHNTAPFGRPAKARGSSYRNGCSHTPVASLVLGTLLCRRQVWPSSSLRKIGNPGAPNCWNVARKELDSPSRTARAYDAPAPGSA